jgi:hypothetical protein
VVSVNTTAVGSPYQWDGAVSAKATLTLDLAAQPASITAGNATALTATVKNTGAGPAFGAALRLTLPFGLSAATLPGGCTQAGLALTCALGDLPSQETATRTIPIRPPEIGTYTVIAGASWARPPTVSADTTIGVDAPADPNAGQPSPDPPASPAAPVRRTVSVERVSVGLPGKGRCVRDRVLDVLLRGEPKSATVRVGGAKIRRLTGAKARRPFTLRVPRGARRLTVRISATYADSSVFSATRTWRICARKRR